MKIISLVTSMGAMLAAALLSGSVIAAEALAGIWQSRGWALVVEITGDEAALYQSSQSALLPLGTVALEEGGFSPDQRTRLVFRRTDQGLELADEDQTVRIDFSAIEALPPATSFTDDPITNFEVFAELLSENYALFDLNDIDWEAAVAAARPLVSAATGDDVLFDILTSLLEPLADRHVFLASDDRFYQSGQAPSPFWSEQRDSILDNVADSYLDGALEMAPGDERVRYGTLDGGRVLYLSILDLTAAPSGQPLLPASLDWVLAQFGGGAAPTVEALIVDLRSNGGGRSANGVALLERLTDGQRIAWFRETRSILDGGFTPLDEVLIAPAGENQGSLPAVLLISGQTASAADRIAMGAAFLPNATLIGSTSLGILSDTLDLVLPNGWDLGLSHQRVLTVGGGHFEQQGIAPDIEAQLLPEDLDSGRDPAIEAALAHLESLPAMTAELHDAGPGASGVWINDADSGEGWILEVYGEDLAAMIWFTFPPKGAGPVQAWMTGVGRISGPRIIFDSVEQPVGAAAGAADQSGVNRKPWGQVIFEFHGCDHGRIIYEGPDGFRAGVQRLDRLTRVPGIGCGQEDAATDPDGLARYTGSWFEPGTSSEGWLISANEFGSISVAWFTRDEAGEQLWLTGAGVLDGNRLEIADLQRAVGGRFGPVFNSQPVDRLPWGSLTIDFLACDRALLTHTPQDPSTGSGPREVLRLTSPAGVTCQ